jgi:hypothetical protein
MQTQLSGILQFGTGGAISLLRLASGLVPAAFYRLWIVLPVFINTGVFSVEGHQINTGICLHGMINNEQPCRCCGSLQCISWRRRGDWVLSGLSEWSFSLFVVRGVISTCSVSWDADSDKRG